MNGVLFQSGDCRRIALPAADVIRYAPAALCLRKYFPMLNYYGDPPADWGPLSICAVVSCALAIITLPCAVTQLLLQTVISADLFNSVDVRYRWFFWSVVSGLPALMALVLNLIFASRIRRKRLSGMILARVGIGISLLWLLGALLGLGVFGIDY